MDNQNSFLPMNVEEELLSLPNVSRETLSKWSDYVALLLKWNKSINLIGHCTEADIWSRHILDSAQLLRYIPEGTKVITDFGSGAGLPGLVLALTGRFTIHLVESNQKKASFLRQVAALMPKGMVTIHDDRIEKLTPWQSDILTARALAPLPELLDLLSGFIEKSKLCLFLKGQNVVQEIEGATKYWVFEHELHPSLTLNDSMILAMHTIARRP